MTTCASDFRVLTAARYVLSKQSWPDDDLQKALYGKNEVALLCKSFNFDATLSANIVLDLAN